MIVRHLHTVHELLTVLAQPTAEMAALRVVLSEQGRFPTRRTWERRLNALPESLPAQIGCLGRYLVSLIQPWTEYGRAVAIDSTILRARGGVWHQKHREKGEIPHTSIDTQAHWTRIRLARLGVWLETACRFCRRSRLVPSGGGVDPCQYG